MPPSAKNLFEPQANAGRQTPASAESQRQNGIRSLFAHFGDGRFQNICSELISDKSITVEMAKERILKEIGDGTTPTDTPSAAPNIFVDNGAITNDAIKQSLTARIGLEKPEKDNPYQHSSLFELAKASLSDNNISTFSAGSRQNIVGLAFTHTSSDFGNILIDVANKSVLKGWDDAPETFEQWTQKGTLTNFKEGRRVGLHGFGPLREVKEGAEYKYVSTDDYGEPIILATYGELFSITRQAIINDDLQMLSAIPQAMGRAARRTIGDLVYAVLINNANMSDGKPLFDSEHNNLIGEIMGQEGISRGRYRMRMQKDSKGNVLNIQPSHMIVPADLESKAIVALKSLSLESASNTGVVNPVHEISKLVVEPRLDSDSTNAWYMAANNQTIEVAYLDGIDTPYIEQSEGFTVDGVATKVRIDAGVAPLDYRGVLKSTGVGESKSS
ncbi:prophage Clp protease-like protein [Vibrio astriarenae]|nr:prophage Clp protease-like protein [Vibrio sp. C7]